MSPLAIFAIFAVVASGLGLASYLSSQAAASGASAFDINGGATVTVGGGAVPYVFTITNNSTSPQDVETVQLTAITGYPSCEAIELSSPLCTTAGNQDAGVFSPSGTGTGAVGTACAGNTFTVTENAAGLWTFTPLVPATYPVLGPKNVGGPLATCAIAGLATVDALPLVDANPIAPGVQTQQLSDARGTTGTTFQQFIGLGTAELTVKAPPQIATTSNPTGGNVVPGTSVSDSATLSGGAGNPVPTGTVKFFLCQPATVTANGGDCSAGGDQIGTPAAGETLAAGSASSESSTNTTTIGKYCWRAEYSGDVVYTAASHTNSTTECFTTVKQPPTIATTSTPTGGSVVPGTSVSDSATVSGGVGQPTPTGTVAFFLCQPATVTANGGTCSVGGDQVGTPAAGETLNGSGVAQSESTTNTTAIGKYCWRAEYSGDSFYNSGSHTNGTSECFTTSKQPPTIATTSTPTGTGVTPGTSVSDSATVSGGVGQPTPTGTVKFFLCQPATVTANGGTCSAGGDQIGTPAAGEDLVAGVAQSESTTNTTAIGKYCWRAEYSGDSFYNSGSHTNSTTECFTTAKQPPTIATTSTPTGTGVTPGTSVSDSATVSGGVGQPTPTGTVKFFLCQPATVTANGGTCSAGGDQIGTPAEGETLNGSGVAQSESTTNTTAIGKYCWRAEYSGDSFYNSGSHTNSTTECFTTSKLPPTIVTTSSPTGGNVVPGTSVTDTAGVTGPAGQPIPSGTVKFFLCQPATVTANGGTCSAGGDQIGTPAAGETLVNGVAISEASTNTTAIGKYCWRAEYSGDANYDAASHTNSTTECFTTVQLALEGCTPGYWKANADNWGAVSWPTPYVPTTKVKDVFALPASFNQNLTLRQALDFGGGPGVDGAKQILLRAAVAGLLNSASGSIDYPWTTADLIAAVNLRLASSDRAYILALATRIDNDNNLGCPINQRGIRS